MSDNEELDQSADVAQEAVAPAEDRVNIALWAHGRLSRSVGRIEMLMVYVQFQEAQGHIFDLPSVFERDFLNFCNAPVQ